MKTNKNITKSSVCPICGGMVSKSKTTFTVDYGSGVLVVRNVPALVCDHCSDEWIDDETSAILEERVNDSKSKKQEPGIDGCQF